MKKRILVVDDEKIIRDTRALLLRAMGYEVTLAEHGFDALVQLKTPPLRDVIISDLNMPHMSGFEFLSVLRRRFPQISVIASSGAYHSGDLVPGGYHRRRIPREGRPARCVARNHRHPDSDACRPCTQSSHRVNSCLDSPER